MRKPVRGFKTPPEIVRYLEEKNLKPAFSWQDVWGEENAYNFAVAKAVELDLLTAFKTSIQTAIENGEGFESWRGKIVPELQRLGWYGRRKVEDPTGQWKTKIVDFSRPARLQLIFWSNVRSARAAGDWARAQETKRGLPYLVYTRTKSVDPRLEHLAWVGVILPVDDPFWRTHFPPNGWNCKCSTLQITQRRYNDVKDQDGFTTEAPVIEWTTFTNARTGEVTRVPKGIDPGWGQNAGLSRARTLVENYSARLATSGETAARASIEAFVNSPAPRVLASIAGEAFDLPTAVMNGRIVTAKSTSLAGDKPRIRANDLPMVQRVIDAASAREKEVAKKGFTLRGLFSGVRWVLALSRVFEILRFDNEE